MPFATASHAPHSFRRQVAVRHDHWSSSILLVLGLCYFFLSLLFIALVQALAEKQLIRGDLQRLSEILHHVLFLVFAPMQFPDRVVIRRDGEQVAFTVIVIMHRPALSEAALLWRRVHVEMIDHVVGGLQRILE